TAADGANGDQFGYALGVSGERMALGANLDDVAAKADQGSIYIFKGEDCPGAARPESIAFSQPHGLAPAPSVRCWPNPFRDELAIEINAEGAVQLTVTDAAGRVMASMGLPIGQVRFDLNTSEFRAGLYFVQVTAGNSVRVLPVALVR
ncbi:MAG: T9SS type A sorting domain-containing protein, partial [Saprospiraceae bacterium]